MPVKEPSVVYRELFGAEGIAQIPVRPDGSATETTDIWNPVKSEARETAQDMWDRLGATQTAQTAIDTRLTNTEATAIAYEDRAAFLAATIPAPVMVVSWLSNGQRLSVQRDASGPIAQADGTKWKPLGGVYPDHFVDNTTPGVTEMAGAAQDAVEWVETLGGGKVKFIDGVTYKVSAMVDITGDNVEIDVGAATIDASSLPDIVEVNRPDGIFNVLGSSSAVTTLASSASKDAETITVTSASGMSIGDVVLLYSSTERWYQEGVDYVRKSTVNRIANISGTTVTLQNPLDLSFDTGVSSVTVTSWAGVHGFKLSGGYYIGPGYEGPHTNGEGPAVIYSLFTQGLVVEGIKGTVGFQGAWMYHQKGCGTRIKDNIGSGLPEDYTDALVEGDNKGFTGIIISETLSARVVGNRGYRFRHLVDGGRSIDVLVEGNFAFHCHRPPFGSHGGCTHWTFSNNYSRSRISGGDGCLWRGHSVSLINNDFNGTISSGSYGFYDTEGHQDDVPKTYRLIGNKFRSARAAVGLFGNVGLAEFTDNDLYGGIESTAYSPVEIGTLDADRISFRGGSITCHSGGDGAVLTGSASLRTRRLVSFEGVKFKGYSSNAVSSPANSALNTTLIVRRNDFVPTGSPTTHVEVLGSSYDLLDLSPNYYNGSIVDTDDSFGALDFTLVLSDGTNTVTPQITRSIQWRYERGIFTGAFSVRINSKGSLSGSLRLIGWPKQPAGAGAGTVGIATGLAVTAGQTVVLQPINGSDRVDMLLNDGAGGTSALQASEITDTFRIDGVISYVA